MIQCADIASPVNGEVKFFPDSVAPFKFGTTANYSCYTGFALTGDITSRTCDGNESSVTGHWTGETEPPRCGMY